MHERPWDDPATPLHEVTFCVVDLETTGGAPASCGITEVGAVKVRGGSCLGTFQTLVNPGAALPPSITVLTGITEAMVVAAPRIEQVLPAFVEFASGAVLVGHNVRFDVAFLQAALARDGWSPLTHPTVDTCALARRLLGGEVPDHRLGTLARHLRLPNVPSHRALDDAMATTDLLHLLIERAAGWGATALDDLVALPSVAGHPAAGKLTLTTGLPRARGVYLLRDRHGHVLDVGRADDLRAAVRARFAADQPRRSVLQLRQATRIDHHRCTTDLEAEVVETRLRHRHRSKEGRPAWVQLEMNRPRPGPVVVRRPPEGMAPHLGPFPSTGHARRVAVGLDAAALDGARLARALLDDPDAVLVPLRDQVEVLAAAQRYEEAAARRDQAELVAAALHHHHRLAALRRSGRLRLRTATGDEVALHHGILQGAAIDGPEPPTSGGGPLDPAVADELACVAAWLDRQGADLDVVAHDGRWQWPTAPVASFAPIGWWR